MDGRCRKTLPPQKTSNSKSPNLVSSPHLPSTPKEMFSLLLKPYLRGGWRAFKKHGRMEKKPRSSTLLATNFQEHLHACWNKLVFKQAVAFASQSKMWPPGIRSHESLFGGGENWERLITLFSCLLREEKKSSISQHQSISKEPDIRFAKYGSLSFSTADIHLNSSCSFSESFPS